ncbi:hypothetical protein [Sphingosinicella sp.]|uniref:hypothetical protein n=1 Tax=Sphingosinicella sp. TaxID=1917971 RepID=UPI004037A47A
MIARGFKPVAWVAAVAVPALGCYMLSLKVAAERAELANIETRILAARQDIRTLQTELGTRGRLQQLEQWNAEVLALAAPVANQFVARDVNLARFDTRVQEFTPAAPVQVAAAEAPRAPNPVELAPRQASLERPAPTEREAVVPDLRRTAQAEDRPAVTPRRTEPATPLVRRASLATEARQAAPPPQRRPAAAPRTERTRPLVSAEAMRAIGRQARAERD